MLLPFFIALVFFFFYDTQLWADRCPSISIDEMVSDVLLDHKLAPQNPEAPVWHLLSEGDIETWSKLLINDTTTIEKRDEFPLILGDTIDLRDAPSAPPRVYCRYWLKQEITYYPLIFYIDLKELSETEKDEELEETPRIHTPPPSMQVMKRMYHSMLIPYPGPNMGVFSVLLAMHQRLNK